MPDHQPAPGEQCPETAQVAVGEIDQMLDSIRGLIELLLDVLCSEDLLVQSELGFLKLIEVVVFFLLESLRLPTLRGFKCELRLQHGYLSFGFGPRKLVLGSAEFGAARCC